MLQIGVKRQVSAPRFAAFSFALDLSQRKQGIAQLPIAIAPNSTETRSALSELKTQNSTL